MLTERPPVAGGPPGAAGIATSQLAADVPPILEDQGFGQGEVPREPGGGAKTIDQLTDVRHCVVSLPAG